MPPNDNLTEETRTYPPINFHDDTSDPSGTFDRYRATGELIIKWANDPASRPKDMDELRAALDGLVSIPANMKTLEYDQGDDSDPNSTVFVLRLPPKNQLNESRAIQSQGGNYPLPAIYLSAFPAVGLPEPFSADWLSARVADYTMRGCR